MCTRYYFQKNAKIKNFVSVAHFHEWFSDDGYFFFKINDESNTQLKNENFIQINLRN